MSFKKKWNAILKIVYRILSRIIVGIAVLLLLIVMTSIFLSVNGKNTASIILSFLLLGIIVYVYRKRKALKHSKRNSSWLLFREISKIVLGLVILACIVVSIKLPHTVVSGNDAIATSEKVVLYVDSLNNTASKYYESTQTWYDFSRKKQTIKFRVDYDSVIKSKTNRESFVIDYKGLSKFRNTNKSKKLYYSYFWNNLYNNLVKNDKALIEHLSQEFDISRKRQALNRKQFAELMITAIQDIPYVLVRSDSCKIEDLKPCVGNIKFGLFAPAEYVSNLQGDCDTRTVLLYTLLKRFNYDVAIVNSKAYKHSMLGINIPSTGKFKAYKNKKYYFVETTSRNCPIGYLPKDFSRISNWDFALLHNIE